MIERYREAIATNGEVFTWGEEIAAWGQVLGANGAHLVGVACVDGRHAFSVQAFCW